MEKSVKLQNLGGAKSLNNSKAAIVVSKMVSFVQLVIGYCLAIMFGFVAIFSMFDHNEDGVAVIIILWIITLIGLAFIIAGNKRKKSIKEFKRYVTFLSGDSTGSILNLASVAGTTQDIIIKNLDFMIQKKYFTNAYINRDTNCIIIGNVGSMVKETVEYVTFTCKNCGGINKIEKGKVGECDYCGSPVQ